MTKLKKTLIIIAFFVCCFTPLFSGCSYTTKLSAPEISLFSSDYCIAFQSVAGASSYKIYCNDDLVDTYKNEEDLKSIVYDVSGILEESGKYEFYVVSHSGSLYLEDSDPSNVVELNYTKIDTPVTPPISEDKKELAFSVSEQGVVSYTPIAGVTDYVLYLYSNTTGLKSYNVHSNIINLKNTEFSLAHEIYAIRVGYSDEGGVHISSDVKYYNPDKCSPYTDTIYVFDGSVNDYYISSLDELNNIMYYSYIKRIESFDIKLTPTMRDNISRTYSGNYLIEKVNAAVIYAVNQYYETQAYKAGQTSGGFVKQLSTDSEYNIKVSYYGVKECDISISASNSAIYKQGDNTAYYETVDYTMLGDNYDDFVSDDYFLYTECTTSEELYWAIENKITPIVTEGSRADIIYTKAKEVLKDIISLEMTDYEKALSIFDWIAINTNYDYTNYDNIFSGGICLGKLPMYLPCYYLEGVFITGNAVCDGFSKAYSMMCNMVGIDCIRIVGTAITNGKSGGHAWNKVYIDKDGEGGEEGQYYLVDITWTDMLQGDNEVTSHLYFLLGDNDVKDTHKNFYGRANKFNKYAAKENYYYYDNHNYTCIDSETKNEILVDLVVENSAEMKNLFYDSLQNSYSSMEFVVDLEYMIKCYEYKYGVGSYRSSNKIDIEKDLYGNIKSKYDHSTDTFYQYYYTGLGTAYIKTYNYYKLRQSYLEDLRELKNSVLKVLYYSVSNYDGELVYNKDGDLGILYVMEQNLCLNEVGEEELLINYLADNNITGDFDLYVEDVMFVGLQSDNKLSLLQELLADLLEEKGLELIVSYLGMEDGSSKYNISIS